MGAGLFGNPFVPSPIRILTFAKSLVTIQWIKLYIFPSFLTFICGSIFGGVLGITLAGISSLSTTATAVLIPIVNFVRNIPSVAKIPLFIALFGIGTWTRIWTVSLAVFLITYIATSRAIRETDSHYLDTSRLLSLSKWRTLFAVELPAAMSEILASLQIGFQVGIVITIVSEMLGAKNGLGAFISQSESTFSILRLWVGLISLGVIGFGVNYFFHLLQKKLVPWINLKGEFEW